MGCCFKQSRKCSDGSPSGLWLDVASIPTSGTIKQGETCYSFSAEDQPQILCHGTLHSGYSSVTGCNDTACATTPCVVCTGSNAPSSLAIQGYFDGMFSLGTGCDGCYTSTAPAWDGVFHQVGTSCSFTPAAGPFSIGGKQLYTYSLTTSLLPHPSGSCAYQVIITCYTMGGIAIWIGNAATTNVGAGTYTRAASSCATGPASIVIA